MMKTILQYCILHVIYKTVARAFNAFVAESSVSMTRVCGALSHACPSAATSGASPP